MIMTSIAKTLHYPDASGGLITFSNAPAPATMLSCKLIFSENNIIYYLKHGMFSKK